MTPLPSLEVPAEAPYVFPFSGWLLLGAFTQDAIDANARYVEALAEREGAK